jgi:curved DNA-binding protein CbpA
LTRNKSFYDLLGIDPESEDKEIKRAYRKKAEKYHPDRYLGADPAKREYALKQMKELNEAKDILLDSEKRQLYDSLLHEQSFDYGQDSWLQFNAVSEVCRLSRLCEEMDRKGYDAKLPKRLLKQSKMAMKDEDLQYAHEKVEEAMEFIEENYPALIKRQRRLEDEAQREIDRDLPSFDYFRQKIVQGPQEKQEGEVRGRAAEPPPDEGPGRGPGGKKKARPNECPKCFNGIAPDQDYCYYCGYRFD